MSQKKGGFIQIIIILVLVIIILSLLGVSLRALFNNPALQDNFGFVGSWLQMVWNNYLAAPFAYLWNSFLRPIFCAGPFVQCS